MRAAHPNIYAAVELFRAEENNAQLEWYSAENNDKPPYIRRSWVINEEELRTFKQMLHANEITPEVYLKRVSCKLAMDKIEKTVQGKAMVSSSEEDEYSDSDDETAE